MFQTFLPLYAASKGADAQEAAHTLTVYLVVGALGGLVGGSVADRLGRDRVIIGSLLLSAPFSLALAFQNEVGPLFWFCAAMSGFLLNGSFVVLTVRGQESIPGSVSMMSGMMRMHKMMQMRMGMLEMMLEQMLEREAVETGAEHEH